MKARHRSLAEALRFVHDDLQVSLVEAPDAEIVELSRGCWVSGAEAALARDVLRRALLPEGTNARASAPSLRPPTPVAPARDIGAWRIKPRRDEEG
jgi:hypothetical protein